MSDKEECKVCGSYTSNIAFAWRDNKPCPYCGAYELDSIVLEKSLQIKKQFQAKNADKELIEKITSLTEENAKLSIQVNALSGEFYSLCFDMDDLNEKMNNFKDKVDKIKANLERVKP